MTIPDLTHVDTWIFDLDNTLYPPGSEFVTLMEGRMTAYVARETGLGWDEARALQKRYYHEHGTTLAGMMAVHGIAAQDFLDDVHDAPIDSLSPDPALRRALQRLPGRRLVFTNASGRHAERVLAHLRLDDLFDEAFHIEAAELVPKPQAGAYASLISAHGVRPASAAFFEDSEVNLGPAHELGMTTVLVGPHAAASAARFVDYRTADLTPFLNAIQVGDPVREAAR